MFNEKLLQTTKLGFSSEVSSELTIFHILIYLAFEHQQSANNIT